MARIAFILLCHKDPAAIIEQAKRLTAAGDYMAIHFDARSKPSDYALIKSALKNNGNVAFAARRVKCGWGAWSLVEATLHAIQAAVDSFPRATHFFMVSGDCMAIKSARFTHDFLDADDGDFIESFDYFTSDWIKTGFKEDRLIYRHYFNERTHKRLFYGSHAIQKRLGLARKVPADLRIMVGSQWWCLRRRTIEWILEFVRNRPDAMRFFRTTWIPDETFFQTLVRHLVPTVEIRDRSLTFLMFSDYGMPVTFHNDHYDLLLSQDFLFARKISGAANDLKARLGAFYASEEMGISTSNEGKALFSFLRGRGRVGRRYGTRFWERQTALGRDKTLFVIMCKKWHVAKRFVERLNTRTGMTCVGYLFDETDADLPAMGGFERGAVKRLRHRRAFLGLLYDAADTDQLVICLDPGKFDILDDIRSDTCQLRVLEIECQFDESYIAGHARRVGLAGVEPVSERLLSVIRQTFDDEIEHLRGAGLARYARISETGSDAHNASALATFADIAVPVAEDILAVDYLFED